LTPKLRAVEKDFAGLFVVHSNLKALAFNSINASKMFNRWVDVDTSRFQKLILPSTSPMAALPFEKKVAAWAVLRTI
jgi:G:T/U-mismatch repair DNA glycosylase